LARRLLVVSWKQTDVTTMEAREMLIKKWSRVILATADYSPLK